MKYRNKNGGLIQLIFILIIALLALRYLNVNLKDLLANASVHDFFVYLWGQTKLIWTDFMILLSFIKGIVTAGAGHGTSPLSK